MREVDLYTSDGGFVVTVLVPAMVKMPDIIRWGARSFIREEYDKYLEGFVCVALVTKK
jgi:hypothetical protein